MSGGSYDYLCFKDVPDLFNNEGTLASMRDRLIDLGYAEDAARETEEIILMLRQVRIRIEVRTKRLSEVWRAVEWWDSGDVGEDSVKSALAKYREEK